MKELYQRPEEQKILIVDDQSFNIDAAMIILKYAVKLKNP